MFLTPTQINLSKFRIFLFKKRANLNNVGDLIWVPILDDKIMMTKNAHLNQICKLQTVTNTRRQNLTWYDIIYQRT